MKLIIDCMGGDHAPHEMLAGVIAARAEYGGDYLLVGNRSALEAAARERSLDISGFEILHAESVITMEDEPVAVLRTKTDSSMTVALKALSEGQGDALVSCGNTGALFAGATLIVKRAKGVHRAAIGTVVPFQPPLLLLDSGANVEVRPDFLVQFAMMGSAYMSSLYGLEAPRVGLLNNGTEETKGTPLQTEAYRLLAECKAIRFVGNVEGSQLPFDVCDVVVTDGFTGNVTLKTLEGVTKMLMKRIKGIFYKNAMTKLAALPIKGEIDQLKRDFDATEHGGSPILGVRRPVIKAHGSSDAKAFKNAIRQAIRLTESGALADMQTAMAATETDASRKEE